MEEGDPDRPSPAPPSTSPDPEPTTAAAGGRVGGRLQSPPRRTGGARALIDDAAEESDDASGGGSDDDDDDDESLGSFLADEDEDDAAGDGDASARRRRRKKKRRRPADVRLDDDDYDLLEENQVTGVRRPPRAGERRRLRKKIGAAGDGDRAAAAAAAAPAPPAGVAAANERDLERQLFDGDDDDDDDDGAARAHAAADAAARTAARARRSETPDAFRVDDDTDDDGLGDFIATDEEEDEEGGGARRTPGRGTPQPRARRRRRPAATDAVAAEIDALFGAADVDAMLEAYEAAAAAGGDASVAAARADAAAAADLAPEDFGSDDEGVAAARAYAGERAAARAAAGAADAAAVVEPTALAAAMLRPEDAAARAADLPERVLADDVPAAVAGGGRAAADALDAAARWVHARLFAPGAPRTLAGVLVAQGVLEVDGPPLDGRDAYDSDELVEGATDLARGRRGLRRPRRAGGRAEARWRADAGAQAALVASVRHLLARLWVDRADPAAVAVRDKAALGELLALAPADAPALTTAADAGRRAAAGLAPFPVGTVQAAGRRARRLDVVWAVVDEARRWAALARRCAARRRVFSAAAAAPDAPPALAEAASSALAALDGAASMDDVADADAAFELARAAAGGAAGGAARAPAFRAASAVALCARAGLDDLVAGFGMDGATLADNLAKGYRATDPADAADAPAALAARVAASAPPPFNDPPTALRAASALAAARLAAEPGLRAHVRRFVAARGAVTTAPTRAGAASPLLDPFHAYGRVRRLEAKPVSDFEGCDLMLRVDAAEAAGLIDVRVDLLPADASALDADVADLYLSPAATPAAVAWNDARRTVLRDALAVLVRGAAAAARRAARAGARAVAAAEYEAALWRLAARPPLVIRVLDEETVVDDPVFVGASHGGGGGGGGAPGTAPPCTAFAALDERGALDRVLFTPRLSGRLRPPRAPRAPGPAGLMPAPAGPSPLTDPRTAADAAALRAFVKAVSPSAVLVGCASSDGVALRDVVAAVREDLLEHDPAFFTRHEAGDVVIDVADERVAAVWAASAAAAAELGDQPVPVRRAVAVARLGRDPVAVLASLAGGGGEIAGLTLTDTQAALGRDAVLASARRVLRTLVAQTGVDLARVAAAPWRAPSLECAPGLGPRKAAALLRAVAAARGGRLPSRADLASGGGLPPRVFDAAAPCLRLGGRRAHPLDGTRVHPADYHLAVRVARAALGAPPPPDVDPAADAAVVADAMKRARDVEGVDLVAVDGDVGAAAAVVAAAAAADGAAADGDGDGDAPPPPPPPSCLTTLVDASFELVAPGGEVRPPAAAAGASADDEFWLATGASPAALRPGLPVDVVIRWAGQYDARGALPGFGDVEAVLPADAVSASGAVDPRDHLRRGDVVAARVTRVAPEERCVYVTTASDALNDAARWEEELCGEDPYYVATTNAERAAAAAGPRKPRPAFVDRRIDHPNFANVTRDEAAARLADPGVEVGQPDAALLRPSPAGPYRLCLSVKLFDGPGTGPVILHRDVHESRGAPGVAGGAARRAGAHLQLKPPLTVGVGAAGLTDTFDDVDELLARYVDPLAAAARDVARHRRYVDDADWGTVKARLLAEFDAGGRRAPAYCVAADAARPGFGYVGAVLPTRGATPRREHFAVTPRGVYFRSRLFKTLERALAEFKKDPQGVRGEEGGGGGGGMPPPPPQPPTRGDATPLHEAASAADAFLGGLGGGAAAAAGGDPWGAPPPPPPQAHWPPPAAPVAAGGGGGVAAAAALAARYAAEAAARGYAAGGYADVPPPPPPPEGGWRR